MKKEKAKYIINTVIITLLTLLLLGIIAYPALKEKMNTKVCCQGPGCCGYDSNGNYYPGNPNWYEDSLSREEIEAICKDKDKHLKAGYKSLKEKGYCSKY